MQQIRFLPEPKDGFYDTLRRRVQQHFDENGNKRYANASAIFKSILFTGIFVGLYILILNAGTFPIPVFFGLWLLMGMFVIFAAMSMVHDAAHQVYSRHKWVNEVLLRFMNLAGADGYIYRYKHNVAHHPFTNIPGVDIDLEQSSFVKVTPHSAQKRRHRFQHLYLAILYPISFTLFWLLLRDVKYYRLNTIGLRKTDHHPFHITFLAFGKLFYFTYMLVIPSLVLPLPFWMILLGFLCAHVGSGLVAIVALLANHVVEDSEFPLPDSEGRIHTTWAEHQLRTTDDFNPDSAMVSYWFSGLNHHVAHHIFPNYCHHVHLPAVTKILRETAAEFGLRYRHHSILGGIRSHFRLLQKARMENDVKPVHQRQA